MGVKRKVEEFRRSAEGMLDFIEQSPSCFHAIDNLGRKLDVEGYRRLTEAEDWQLKRGEGYYVVRNESSLIAFRLPKEAEGFHIVASHSDSPTFKVKENPEITMEDYLKLNTEKYGGMILSSWLDRPLSVAGRLAVCEKDRMTAKLVDIDQDLLVIPNVAIHMNREMNKGVEYNPQTDMLPLFAGGAADGSKCEVKTRNQTGDKPDGSLLRLAAQYASVEVGDIMGHDLFLYVRDRGRFIGRDNEFVLSPKLDDLQCAYVSMEAFLKSRPDSFINVCGIFDHEEVGSSTRQGADSTFLEEVLSRICEAMWNGKKSLAQAAAASFLISADNAHAVHPNHPEKADPTNRPYLNGGIVIKYHGSQKYTTDGMTAARMKYWCQKAGVPCQTYANRSDIPGGSTLGNILQAHVSLPSVDIGLPQLAMHSAVETAGTYDTEYAIRALKEFYSE